MSLVERLDRIPDVERPAVDVSDGYYELEVGSSGETIWVPVNGVVPE